MNARQRFWGVISATVLLLLGRFLSAEELKSGLQTGEQCSCLSVIWLVNWPGDGSFQGCMIHDQNTTGPVAVVFVRTVDDRVSELVLALDLQVTKWGSEKGPKAFLCGVGGLDHEHLARLKKAAVDVPLTIPSRNEVAQDQIAKHKLSEKAAVTVIVYDEPAKKVIANHVFSESRDLTRQKIKQIVKELTARPSDECQ